MFFTDPEDRQQQEHLVELGVLWDQAQAAYESWRKQAEKELGELLGRTVVVERGEVHVTKAEWAKLLSLVEHDDFEPRKSTPTDLASVKVIVDD